MIIYSLRIYFQRAVLRDALEQYKVKEQETSQALAKSQFEIAHLNGRFIMTYLRINSNFIYTKSTHQCSSANKSECFSFHFQLFLFPEINDRIKLEHNAELKRIHNEYKEMEKKVITQKKTEIEDYDGTIFSLRKNKVSKVFKKY